MYANGTPRRRTKRGPFNFVGTVASKLFGVTSEEDLAQVKEQIAAIRQLQKSTPSTGQPKQVDERCDSCPKEPWVFN